MATEVSEKKPNLFFTVMGWVFGLQFIFGSAVTTIIPESPTTSQPGFFIMGVGWLLAGLLILPPTLKFARARVEFLTKRFAPPLLALGSFFLFAVVAQVIDPQPTAPTSKNGQLSVNATATNKFEAEGNGKEISKVSAGTPQTSENIRATYRRLLSQTKDCDDSLKATASWMKGSATDVFEAYSAAKATKQICLDVASDIDKFAVPEGVEYPVKGKFKDAYQQCASAYLTRSDQAAQIMTALDNRDFRPSVVARLQDTIKSGDAGVILCIGRFMTAAGEAGLKAEDLTTLK
jgi:hypothetical protein